MTLSVLNRAISANKLNNFTNSIIRGSVHLDQSALQLVTFIFNLVQFNFRNSLGEETFSGNL
jgi:hypothetical protein